MGWRYRKSRQVGPMRVTFSKRGVSKSMGNRFLRVTDTAAGHKQVTFTLPGTGLSWVKTFGKRDRSYQRS